MVQKRQLAEEEYDVSPKHLKLENSCKLVSCLEFPSKDVPLKPCNSGIIAESRFIKETTEIDNQLQNDKITATEYVKPEAPVLKPRTLVQPEDAYSRLLRSPPLKSVPIGHEFQADIPEFSEIDPKNVDNKFIGSCIIPMPESDSVTYNDDATGRGKPDCFCKDPGSLRCVRKHVQEARENLRGEIGNRRFSELGFYDMGDDVACKWTEEDEQLFHEVVYSNPVSVGKNFWNILPETFPSKTNQEIVSYYFNVFMLQKRAEQNRFDPMNPDSDDDEWQGSDQSDDDDEDLCQDEVQQYNFSIENPFFDSNEDTGLFHFREHSEKTLVESCGDDSCTSSDIEPQSGEVKVHCSQPWTNHDFIFEPSDSKVWDVGYFSFPKNETDFLPTGSMIEEVFGVESWNFEVTDNDKGSI